MCVPPRDGAPRRATAALGSRRLSIIDLAGGHQPIANEDGSIWTVQNGEIYNFRELRTQLEREGHRFATRTDTEVIVHAYEQWGDDFVRHLDGMFALAVWDVRAAKLTLARDRFGKKPLLYYRDDRQVVFASELQALAQVADLPRDIDMNALGAYLGYMAIPAPATIYRHIRKLPPAHVLRNDGTGVQIESYWKLSFTPKTSLSERDAVDGVRELFTAAVKKRLVSDVPLGAFLSGGVDSSAVVAVMAELSSRPVKTFSIGFGDRDFDELPDARRVAERFGCEHHEHVVRPSAVDILPSMVRHFGEPFADSSAIPSWYLSQMTRQGVTVALSGDGGDELFAGYNRHLANRLAERWSALPALVRQPLQAIGGSGPLGTIGGARFRRFARAASLRRDERYRSWAGVFSPECVASLSDAASGPDPMSAAFDEVADLDAVDAMLAVDTRVYLPSDLLPKVDVMSMAHSLEVRSPLLDTALAEFVAPLPSTLKLRGVTTKHLLKEAITHRLPAATLTKRKQGFAVPLARWLRGDLRPLLSDHLGHSQVAQAGLVRQSAVDALVAAHVGETADHAHQLWTLLMLELWWRECPHS